MGRQIIIAGVVTLLLIITALSVIWFSTDDHTLQTRLSSPDTGDPIRLTYTAGEIPDEINQSIADTTRDLDDLAAIPEPSRNFTNTDVRLDEILADFDEKTLKYSLVAEISTDPAVKSDAEQASYHRDEFLNAVYLREDIAHALSRVTPDQGIDRELHNRLTDDFSLALIQEDVTDEMTNLSENLSVRGSAYLGNQHDGNASLNLPLIPEIVGLREQITALLGYDSFADYQIAHSGVPLDRNSLLTYLYNASVPSRRASHEEAAELLCERQKTDPGASAVYDYEIPSLRSGLSSRVNDTSAISAFFPAENVIERLNDLVSEIFGIPISPVTFAEYPGIHLFRIPRPNSSDTQAWFYLWIRQENSIGSTSGKTYFIRAGHESNDRWIPPISALIVSVPGTGGREINLSPVDLQVLFHEYGHLLRHSLATGRYATLSSSARDPGGYSEVYSLFFEQFLWTPEVLDRMSGKKKGGDGLPSSLRDQIIAGHGEEAGWGSGYIQVYPYFLSLLDLEIHSGNRTPDFISLYDRVYQNLTGYRAGSGPSSLLLNPAFFISDNAGIYWHYVLDDTCVKEIFSRFQRDGVLNQSTGIVCRQQLFEPAGSVNTPVLIRNFLNRSDDSGICPGIT
nr:M3 family metallopeptidase [uncultured Methanospirillum sp.]